MHLPIPEGEVLGFQEESDGLRFAGLEMNPFEAAEVLFISRHAGHEFMRVELDDFIAFARAGVGYVNSDGNVRAVESTVNPVATARGTVTSDERSDLQIAIGECGVTQAVAKKVKRAVDASPLAFPLR